MDAERIETRLDILANVDAAECGSCGRDASACAFDAGWFVDSEADETGTERAIIRCPLCW